jgi:hypothetical protein
MTMAEMTMRTWITVSAHLHTEIRRSSAHLTCPATGIAAGERTDSTIRRPYRPRHPYSDRHACCDALHHSL